jgi:FKBP-type peptidyl-prolyl cis-trans isomerase
MYVARRSITALFGGADPETQVVGVEISGPTQSYPAREWAANKRMSAGVHHGTAADEASGAEIKHMHMQLLAERDRVKELEQELKAMMAQKYENESSIIDQLRSSQDRLREQLQIVVQSKMELCESTSLEMERLRLIIAELTNHLRTLNGHGPEIDIDGILSKYTQFTAKTTSQTLRRGDVERKEEDHEMDDGFGRRMKEERASGNAVYIDRREMNEVLNNPQPRDPKLPRHLQPFPHHDTSRIDIRTVEMGDGKTWPDPFAAVDLQYTGWKFDRNLEKWNKFTSTQISTTVFETRLGNHENIIGLEQAVLTMTLGETARVWVPSRLGYGIHGADPLIPANTDLVFELKLVAVRNEFDVGGPEQSPLDPKQLDHINQEDDEAFGGGSQLTSTNVRALDSMNSGGQQIDFNLYGDEAQYNPHQQGDFQTL